MCVCVCMYACVRSRVLDTVRTGGRTTHHVRVSLPFQRLSRARVIRLCHPLDRVSSTALNRAVLNTRRDKRARPCDSDAPAPSVGP